MEPTTGHPSCGTKGSIRISGSANKKSCADWIGKPRNASARSSCGLRPGRGQARPRSDASPCRENGRKTGLAVAVRDGQTASLVGGIAVRAGGHGSTANARLLTKKNRCVSVANRSGGMDRSARSRGSRRDVPVPVPPRNLLMRLCV